MAAEINIDGLHLAVEAPTTIDAYAARVAELISSGLAVYPIGGGTGLDFGNSPTKPGVALSLAALNRVVDYPIRDLTITVEAGMKVADIQRLLAAQNQRLPVEVSHAEQATIGGAVSTNVFGPRRLSSGTFRDHVIGITVVNDNGELCSAGGRVVKNVAGYDLAKLYTGALGTLGIIVQLTFKLQPVPPASAWVVAPLAASRLAATLDLIHSSATRPAAVDVLDANAAPLVPTSDFVLAVLFEDNAEAVGWQINQLADELKLPLTPVADATAWDQNLVHSPAVDGCNFSLLATTRPSQVAEMLLALNSDHIRLYAHAMSGVIRVGATDLSLETAQTLHRKCLDLATRADGNVVIRRCSSAWKSTMPVWGQSPSSMSLMRTVKQQFDPRHLLNPGRHVT